MKWCFFSVIFVIIAFVRTAPLESTSTEATYLPPVESPPEISSYEYVTTDTGYTYTLQLSNSVFREETFEIKNKGTAEEETIVSGRYIFKGDDGFRYYIIYKIDKDGTHIELDKTPIHRIPPGTLKSLVG